MRTEKVVVLPYMESWKEDLKRHIKFRDFLRNNPDAVRKYSLVKEEVT